MRRLLNLALVIALAPLIFGFIYEGAAYLASVFTLDATKWFLAGTALFLFVYLLFLNSNIAFIEHFLHESEHAVVSFIFTRKLPSRMEIDPAKGSKVVLPKTGGCLVDLAPYYLPLLALPLLVAKALVDLAYSLFKAIPSPYLDGAFDALIGAAFVFHLLCTLREYSTIQTDIKKSGLIPSLFAVLFLNFLFMLLCVTVVVGSYTELLEYAKAAFWTTVDAYNGALEFLTTRALPALGKLIKAIGDRFCRTCTPTPIP
jgi:hypothetical protein